MVEERQDEGQMRRRGVERCRARLCTEDRRAEINMSHTRISCAFACVLAIVSAESSDLAAGRDAAELLVSLVLLLSMHRRRARVASAGVRAAEAAAGDEEVRSCSIVVWRSAKPAKSSARSPSDSPWSLSGRTPPRPHRSTRGTIAHCPHSALIVQLAPPSP